ncbi:hypothetical protein IMCC26134_07495 [Verrucomicrobia bacterium IMCC26134]|jgi:hypothetical protein|nr:hypothetical protein IMCC26134_07495 [Verrucomicrobia bacterium IMCC26134]
MADYSDTSPSLLAALYLEAVLPAIPVLAAQDSGLSSALAGPDFGVVFATSRGLRTRLSVRDGITSACFGPAAVPQPGDVHIWFPSPAQAVRALDGRRRPALALPIGGWFQLPQLKRINVAGKRLEALLNNRPAATDPALAFHAWGNLVVGLAAAATWLRHHPDAPATRARLGSGVVVFSCPALPAPLWLDLATLVTGSGPTPPDAMLMVTITFADLATLLAELDQQLDASAALGLGTLRITGHLPLAENLGLLLLKVGALLKP